MPELLVDPSRPEPMVCMYCGGPATHRHELKAEASVRGGGTDITPVPTGDDPVSAAVGLLMLPILFLDLMRSLAAVFRPRVPRFNADVKPRPPIAVVVTACDRHRRFGDRFLIVAAGLIAVLAGFWTWTIIVLRRNAGTDQIDLAVTLTLSAMAATALLPVGWGLWYAFAGPVLVERVVGEKVVLDRVRPAYFSATGRTPADAD